MNYLKSAVRKLFEPALYLLALTAFFGPLLSRNGLNTSGTTIIVKALTGTTPDDLYQRLVVWEMVAFWAALIALLLSLVNQNERQGYGFLLSLAGLFSLAMEQTVAGNTQLYWQWGYWLQLCAFALAGSFNYLNKSQNLKTSSRPDLNINIITGKAPGKG